MAPGPRIQGILGSVLAWTTRVDMQRKSMNRHGQNGAWRGSLKPGLWLLLAVLLLVPLTACLGSPGGASSSTAVATGTESDQGANGACGQERWPVKTMSDSMAGQVDLTPIKTTVSELTSLSAPKTLPRNGRVVPTELNTYQLTAQLLKAKLESDNDIHIVVAAPNNRSDTMIVEIPSPACPAVSHSRVEQQISTVRQQFVARFGVPPSTHFEDISGTAQITGVGFFDYQHGQTGVAPNAVELHPAIGFQMLGGG